MASKPQQPDLDPTLDQLLLHRRKSAESTVSAAYRSPCPFLWTGLQADVSNGAADCVAGMRTPVAIGQPPGVIGLAGTAVSAAVVGETKISPAMPPGQFLSSDRSNGNGRLITCFAVWRNRAKSDIRPSSEANPPLIILLGSASNAGNGRNRLPGDRHPDR